MDGKPRNLLFCRKRGEICYLYIFRAFCIAHHARINPIGVRVISVDPPPFAWVIASYRFRRFPEMNRSAGTRCLAEVTAEKGQRSAEELAACFLKEKVKQTRPSRPFSYKRNLLRNPDLFCLSNLFRPKLSNKSMTSRPRLSNKPSNQTFENETFQLK